MDILRWTIDNKEWLFSGAGVVIIASIVTWVLRKASSFIRQTRQATERVDDVLASMPQLVAEMRADLLAPGANFIREFFVLPHRRITIGISQKPRFIFYDDDHQNLRGQLDVLEEHDLIIDVTPPGNDYPIYRMTEKLGSSLCNGVAL